jgi:hypothetical protein
MQISSTILPHQVQKHIKKIIRHEKFNFISGMQEWFNLSTSIDIMQQINRIKDKTHIIISIMQKRPFIKFNISSSRCSLSPRKQKLLAML